MKAHSMKRSLRQPFSWSRQPLLSILLGGISFLLVLPSLATAQEASAAKTGDAWAAAPMDWPNWRGPELNGVSRETGLVDRWTPEGQNVLWKREDLGGRSTPICMRGKLYTLVRDHPDTDIEGEKVVCLDAATGKTIWENVFNVFLSDVPAPRVGWSSVVGDPETGNVFALGVCGFFQCINGTTGKTIWEHSLAEEHGIISAFGGRAAFPVICGNLVYVSSVFVDWGDKARPAQRVIAFDKRNGAPVWYSDTRPSPEDVSYSMPVPTVINGVSQLVVASGDGSVYGFEPNTGKQLWVYEASGRGIQGTPLVVKNRVFLGQAEENRDDSTMGAFFSVDASKRGDLVKSGELWRKKEVTIDKSSAISVDGNVVVVDSGGYLHVINPDTGEFLNGAKGKKLDTAISASPLYADGKIYVCTLSGVWYTLKLNGHNVDVVFRNRLSGGEVNASPIVSHGRIYQQLANVLYCIGEKGKEPQATPRPEPPKEAPAENDPKPALVEVVPCESLLLPEGLQEFQVRLYNSKGQYLRTVNPDEIKFALQPPSPPGAKPPVVPKGSLGQIDKNGAFTAPAGHRPSAVYVQAEFAGLKGTARIRVIPDLNWKFDFNNGQIPVTWVGARVRHVPIDYDLLKTIEKKNSLAGRLYLYLTTGFVNSARPSLKYDNTTPQQLWTELLRYLDLIEKAQTAEKAKAELDPLLKILADEKVVSKWGWSNKQGIQLTVERGPRKIEGNGVLLKVTTIPRGARSQTWFGQSDLHDYTIQADVCGVMNHGRLPDVGVIGQRYTLIMMGDSQKLEIRTWPAHDFRIRKDIPLAWKADIWYTLKFRTSDEGDKVVLRGKVWPRGEKEPDAWTVEATDPSFHPERQGSPGIAGDAQHSEIFYDNILVTKNQPVGEQK
jgi:outer membrane protein assembly factor BamB